MIVARSAQGAQRFKPLAASIFPSGSPSGPLAALDGNLCDLEAFHFFRFQCTASLAGQFDDVFWRRTILQLSHQDQIIRRSILAISCQIQAISASFCPENYRRLATRHYLSAMSELRKHIAKICSDDSRPNTLVLISCILFIGFEVLRGKQEVALVHLLSGLAISKTIKAAPRSGDELDEICNDEVSKMLDRFNVQAAIRAPLYNTANVHIPILPESFNAIHQARDALNSILAIQQFWLRTHAHQFKYAESVPAEVTKQQQAIEGLLRRWSNLLLRFAETSSSGVLAGHILRVQSLAASIRIKTSLLPTESSYDTALTEFSNIVNLSEPIIKIRSDAEAAGESNFTFEMGIIHPLYFTACKCRIPTIRLQALGLLGNAGREGVWDGRMMQAVAFHVMDLEEKGRVENRISEAHLVHGTEVQGNYERQTARVICSTRDDDTGNWIFHPGDVSW